MVKMKTNMIGQRFGRLIVVKQVEDYISPGNQRQARLQVLCDCGVNIEVGRQNLVRGDTRSCGCFRRETTSQRGFKHGATGTIEYRTWERIRNRCANANHADYPRYGGRGIVVCARWGEFSRFFTDMGLRPGPEYSIDRIDNDGEYAPENCRWATAKQQARNKSNNSRITWDGEDKTFAEWAETLGIEYDTLHARIKKLGWSAVRAFTTPVRSRGISD